MDTPVIVANGFTIGASFVEQVSANLVSAQGVLATATASGVKASLSSVVSQAEVTLALVSEGLMAATATDSQAVASATAALQILTDLTRRNPYEYVPSLGGNLVMTIFFFLTFALQIFYAFKYRQSWYGSCVCIGLGLEFAGCVTRVYSHFNPFSGLSAFGCQMICLTIAPCFIMAALYCILAKLVVVYGVQYSLLKPVRYTQIFVVSDVIALVLQGGGGGAAAAASKRFESTLKGTNLVIAGIALQVASMTVFMTFGCIFFQRIRKASKLMDPQFDPRFEDLRQSGRIGRFIAYASLAVIFVYIRSIYRLVELAQGWKGHLMINEPYFLVLDATMMVICAIILCIPGAYPGIVLGTKVSVKKKENVPEVVTETSMETMGEKVDGRPMV